MNPIEKAAEAVVKHILGDDIPDDEWTCCAAIIKRELEKAVPAKELVVYEGRDSRTVGEINGHNECRKAFLGEAE